MLPAHEKEELRKRRAARLRQLMEAMADEELRARKRDKEVLSKSKKVTKANLQGRLCVLSRPSYRSMKLALRRCK